MHHRSSFGLVAAVSCLVFLGQGCLAPSAPNSKGPDGGVFKTIDRGTVWEQKRVLIQGAKGVSIADYSITSLAFDPEDSSVLYAGTDGYGVIYTLDGGDSWQMFKGFAKGRVEDVAVDPKDKCTVFATQANKVFKTVNCGRDWTQTWFDPKTDKVYTKIIVDWFNPTIVYVGTSEGDVLKSTDGGMNWLVAKRADAPISSIAIDPHDSRIVYVGTNGDGVWKTIDAGSTWQTQRQQLSDFMSARRASQVVVDALQKDLVYLVSPYGILVSTDGGAVWKPLPITSPPDSVTIRKLVVNPRDSKQLNYITPNALIFSSDGGSTWNSKKLPSARIATALLVDPNQGNTLYLGMGPLPKQ